MADFRAINTAWSATASWEVWGGSSWGPASGIPTIADKVWLNGQAMVTDSTMTSLTFSRLMNVISGTGNIPPGTGTLTGGTLTIGTINGSTFTVTGDINNGVFGATTSTINVTTTGKTVNFINVPITNSGSSVNIVTISGSNNTISYTRTAGTAGGMFIPASTGTCLYGNSGTGNSITIGTGGSPSFPININLATFNTAASVFSSCTINGNIIGTTNTAFNPGAIGTLTINGDITGGTISGAHGFSMASIGAANIYITGNISGGTAGANGIYHAASSTTYPNFSITGNITATSASAISWGGGTGCVITNLTITGNVSSNTSTAAIVQGAGILISNFTIQNSIITGGTHTTNIIGTQSAVCNLTINTVTTSITTSPVFTISSTTTGSTNQITYIGLNSILNGSSTPEITAFAIANGRVLVSSGTTFRYRDSATGLNNSFGLTASYTLPPVQNVLYGVVYGVAGSTQTGTLTQAQPATVLKDVTYGVVSDTNSTNRTGTLDIPNAVAQVVGNIVANLT